MKKFVYLLLSAALTSATASCSNYYGYDLHPYSTQGVGVMVHEGAWIDQEMEAGVFLLPGTRRIYIIRLALHAKAAEGYTDEQRHYMEELYPYLTSYGQKAVYDESYMGIVGTYSSLTLAGFKAGATVTADRSIAGIPPGGELGGCLTLYAISRDNALRYSYPGFRVTARCYPNLPGSTFSDYCSPGMTLPGVDEGSCICFALPALPEDDTDKVTLTFSVPIEYASGTSFTADGVPAEGEQTFHKTLMAVLTIDPSGQIPTFYSNDFIIIDTNQ